MKKMMMKKVMKKMMMMKKLKKKKKKMMMMMLMMMMKMKMNDEKVNHKVHGEESSQQDHDKSPWHCVGGAAQQHDNGH